MPLFPQFDTFGIMKELLLSYSAYNVWAHSQLLEVIHSLTEEQQRDTASSSFGSIYRTYLHMWNAESIWWQRLKLQERITVPMDTFQGSMRELAHQLLAQSRQWQEWIAGASEPMLQHVFQYQNSKKEVFKQPTWQMLLHVFNHGTYHRGQIVDLLHVQGVAKIPATDYVEFVRKGSKV
jgi:uncharacterized damage-inducible protein DinB